VGGVSLGTMSIGMVSAGVFSLGLLATGILAMGALANGMFAVGWITSAWMAITMHPWAGHLAYNVFYTVGGGGGVPSWLQRYLLLFLVHARTWPSYIFRMFAISLAPAFLLGLVTFSTKKWLSRTARRQTEQGKPEGDNFE